MSKVVDITIHGVEQLRVKLEAHAKRVHAKTMNALRVGAVLIQNDAVKAIQRGPKSGKVYELYKPRRTHRASKGGEAPATDTGKLAREIGFEINKTEESAEVISRAPYSAALEFGTNDGKILPRPFMGPSYLKNLPYIQGLFRDAARG